MKRIKISELRSKSVSELEASIAKMRQEQKTVARAMNLGEMKDVSKIKHLRLEIARCLTIVREKSIQSFDNETLLQAQGGEEK